MYQLKRSLFGYKKDSVQQLLKQLEEEIVELKFAKEKQEATVTQLTGSLQKYKAEVELIEEAAVEVKGLSRNIVREAKEKAAEVLAVTEKDINERFVAFNASMSTLSHLKGEMETYKTNLEQELLALLERYNASVEQVDLLAFEQMSDLIHQNLEDVHRVLKGAQHEIFGETDAPEEQEPSSTLKLVSESEQGVPIYSFG